MCIAAGFLLLCPLLPVPLRHRRRYCLMLVQWISSHACWS